MKKYEISPELKRYCFSIPFNPALLKISHLPQRLLLQMTHVSGIKKQKICINIRKNSPGYKLYAEIYESNNSQKSKPSPCLFYIHGGGFGFEAAPHHKKLACRFAKEPGCLVVFPYYRLLPGNPYPAAREDIVEIYRYICQNSNKLNIDTGKIAAAGDSAGGTLASYLCFDAEKLDLIPLCGQLLLYPVTDMKMNTFSMNKYTDTPLWNSKCNSAMWKMYFDGKGSTEASPMDAQLPKTIPPAYIETAEFDCLHDEGINYAKRLKSSGASIELYETKGTIHGYDIAVKSCIVKCCMEKRLAALRRFFASETEQ